MTAQQPMDPGPIDKDLLILHNRAPWINVMCGLLVFASRWVIHPTSFAASWNLFWTGLAIVAVAMIAAGAHGNVRRNVWSAVNIAGGIWLIVSVSLIANAPAMSWPQIALGIIIITTALTSLSNERLFTRRFLLQHQGAVSIDRGELQ